MVRRSLPERTVDAWVAIAISEIYPNARLWAPTQVIDDTNWDYGAFLGDGKILILEDKATTPVHRKRKAPLYTHRIRIDRDQLNWYCDDVEPNLTVPAYYVLPRPPWDGPPSGSDVVADQSITRTMSLAGPFSLWTFVIRCSDLRTHLGVRDTVDTDTLPIPHSVTLQAFLTAVAACEHGKVISGPGSSAEAAAKGVRLQESQTAAQANQRPRGQDEQRFTGSSLGVFVPIQDLQATR